MKAFDNVASNKLRDLVPALVIPLLLFFPSIFRDIRLPEGTWSGQRDRIIDTLGLSSQSLWCLVILIYITFFIVSNLLAFPPRRMTVSQFLKPTARDAIWISIVLIACLTLIIASRYFAEYRRAAAGTDTLVLLIGIMLHLSVLWLATSGKLSNPNRLRRFVITAFVFIGCLSLAMAPFTPANGFFYHGHPRWTSVFSTPNSLGLFVGVIFMLGLGQCWQYVAAKRFGIAALYLLPIGVSGLCVMKTYSRGAWFSIAAGLLFLLWSLWRRRSFESETEALSITAGKSWRKKTVLWMAAGLLLGAASSYVVRKASQSEITMVHKVFATFGQADFSSLNRLASYQDGIDMLLDKPMTGYGWRSLASLHDYFYLQPGLSDGQAVALNDFLKLALHLGLPAFVIFLLLLRTWLSGSADPHNGSKNYEVTLCRMAVLMFIVSFNFNDGLLRLALGGSFWLFLALSMEFETISMRKQPAIAPVEFASLVANK